MNHCRPLAGVAVEGAHQGLAGEPGRAEVRAEGGGVEVGGTTYVKHLTENPFRVEVFERFVSPIRGILRNEAPVESDVLARGYF